MQRVTITIDDDLAAELDRFMSAHGYANRSEAIRDLARSGLQQSAHARSGTRPCVAALVYVYEHEKRELRGGSPATTTRATIWRRRPCTCTSTRRAVSKSRCSKGAGPTCRSLPTTSLPSAGCATVTWFICRRTRRLRTPPAPRMATVMDTATATATLAVTDAALERTALSLQLRRACSPRNSLPESRCFTIRSGRFAHQLFRCRVPRPSEFATRQCVAGSPQIWAKRPGTA